MAGLGMLDIKRRITSVNSTKQITKAMELVSSSKMRKAKERLDKSKPYFQSVEEAIKDIMLHTTNVKHELVNKREVKRTGYIIISSDRGLAGGYNTNVIKAAENHMAGKDNVSVIAIGQKTKDFFGKRNYNIDGEFTQISEDPSFTDARHIGDLCTELYTQGLVDEVYLVYTEYISSISYNPKVTKLLPLEAEAKETGDKKGQVNALMLYEPSPEMVLSYLIPKYIESMIYGALVESSVSEQSARMIAMKNATDNAEEMIEDLELIYNRARQASITQEIAEIVGGAEALS